MRCILCNILTPYVLPDLLTCTSDCSQSNSSIKLLQNYILLQKTIFLKRPELIKQIFNVNTVTILCLIVKHVILVLYASLVKLICISIVMLQLALLHAIMI